MRQVSLSFVEISNVVILVAMFGFILSDTEKHIYKCRAFRQAIIVGNRDFWRGMIRQSPLFNFGYVLWITVARFLLKVAVNPNAILDETGR